MRRRRAHTSRAEDAELARETMSFDTQWIRDLSEARRQLGRHGEGFRHVCGPASRCGLNPMRRCVKGATGEAGPGPLWPSAPRGLMAVWVPGVGLGHSDAALGGRLTWHI